MIAGSIEIQLMANIARLQRDMDSARRVVGDATAGMSRAADMAKTALAGIGMGLGLSQIIQMSDAFTKFTAQLRLASVSAREYAAAYEDVKRIATTSQQGLQETGVLYARIANGTRELGTSQKQVAAITEAVNMALKVSGATASESASAQLQLSQAFASGTLRGEEFNAVNEAAPRLMLALAEGIGQPVGALKKMAEAGEITSKIMSEALPLSLQKLREEAKEVQTIAGAFTVLKNNMMEFVGIQANASGGVSVLTGAIGLLANNLGLLSGVMATLMAAKLGTWLAGIMAQTIASVTANRALLASNLATAQSYVAATGASATLATARVVELRAAVLAASGATQLAITMNGLIPAQARAALAAEAHAAALAAEAAAMRAASLSAGILRGALAFLGGPIGVILTVLGLGATAWMVWGNKAKEGNDLAKESTVEASAVIIAALDKQIEKNQRIIEMRKQGATMDQANKNLKATESLGALGNDLAAINRGVGANGQRLNDTEQFFEREKVMKSILELTTKMNLAETTGAAALALTQGEARVKFMKEYATKVEQLNEKLAEGRKLLGAAFTPADEARIRAAFADKGAATAIKQEETAYTALVTSIGEKIAANKLEMSGYNKLTDAQKMSIKLDEAIISGKNKLNPKHIEEVRAQIALVAVQDQAIARAEAMAKIQADYAEQIGKSVEDANKEAEANENLVRTFGMTKSAIEQMEIARMSERIEKLRGIDMADDEVAALERIIEAKKRSALALGKVDALEVTKKITDDMIAEGKRMAESIETSLTDALMRGFESGKGFGRNLIDTLKNMFGTLVLRPIISAIVNPVTGAITGAMGVSGAANAASGASALGNAGGALSGLGAMSGAFGSGIASGLSAWGAGGSVTGLLGSGTLFGGGIANGLGLVAGALGPIALGIGGAVAIWKKLDTSGTYHTGGASSASSAGARTIRAESLHFEATRTNAETEKMTAALASGIVSILDSTALAFGKTAGYTAATAFADDTSRDGAWGGLVIDKLGAKILDWQDTRGNGPWAPKLFADGAAGQEQYLAAVSKSVRTALDGIGLPAWAKTMLDGVGAGASIDELAKVVDNINVTQRALVIMGNSLTGFAKLGDKATSALIAASGGIEGLASNASAYYDAFYSEGEKSAGTIKQIKDALAAVNIAMPATQAAYRAQVESQMKLGEAGAPAVAVLLKVAGAFAQVTPQMEAAADAARSAADVLSERIDMQKQLDELTMSSTQLLMKQRNALDASNRGLFDQIQAAQKAKDAQDAARSSLDDFLGQMKSFADTTKGLNGSLLTGSMSTLTPEQQYAETSRQLDQTLAAIRAGDTGAQGNLKSVEDAFLAASMKSNSGDSLYASDFARVLKVNDEISQWASGQIDTAQASLDALNAQVIGINDLNASMLGVADAINGLPAALGATPPAVSMPAPVLNYSTMGTANTEALVAEVKALRDELKGLRADQQKQTGDQIEGNYDANSQVGNIIGAAMAAAIEKSTWVARNRKAAIEE